MIYCRLSIQSSRWHGWLGTAELAAAVSEAGGLGIIGAGHMPPDIFRNEIHKLKERTSKPLAVISCSCLHL